MSIVLVYFFMEVSLCVFGVLEIMVSWLFLIESLWLLVLEEFEFDCNMLVKLMYFFLSIFCLIDCDIWFLREDFMLISGWGENCMFVVFDICRCCMFWVLEISVGIGVVVDMIFVCMGVVIFWCCGLVVGGVGIMVGVELRGFVFLWVGLCVLEVGGFVGVFFDFIFGIVL